MKLRILILSLLFISSTANAFLKIKDVIFAGAVVVEELVSEFVGAEGIQRWLYRNGVYVDEVTGEMYWNGKNGEGQCYVTAIFDGKEKRFGDKDAVCAYEMTRGDWSGWRLYQNLNVWNGYCEYETVPARWGGYYRGVSWQRVCPKSDDCKPFDDFESLDDDSYEYDESDAPFWERVKSRLSPDKGAELDDYLKKKKGKKKKRKRKKKHDIDEEDDSACGKEFKKKGKKRKKPKDDDDEEDEEKDDKDDKDDDKDKDDKDKDDKDKDDKDKKKKDKDDDDKDDDDKDDKDKKKKKDDDCSICELRKDLKKYDEEERGYRKEVLKELRKRNDDEFDRKEPELPKVKDKDYTQSKRINIDGRCPKPYVLNLKVGKVEFSYELICRYAELMRYFVMASAALMSAYILLGVARHG